MYVHGPFMLLLRLPMNSRLVVVKFWGHPKLYRPRAQHWDAQPGPEAVATHAGTVMIRKLLETVKHAV